MADASDSRPGRPKPASTRAARVRLTRWERAAATFVALLLYGVGSGAIFERTNDVATAAVFVLATTVMIMAITGRPIVRIGAGDYVLELLDEADEKEEQGQPQAAEAIREAAVAYASAATGTGAAVSRDAGRLFTRLEAGTRWSRLTGLDYEQAVARALDRVLSPHATSAGARGGPAPYDFAVAIGDATIAVEVKLMVRRSTLPNLRLLAAHLKSQGIAELIVVTASIDLPVLADDLPSEFRLVEWSGPSDDEVLRRAFSQFLIEPS